MKGIAYGDACIKPPVKKGMLNAL